MRAAILFEPDGYLLTGPKVMGRQAAGAGFLRAMVQGRGDGPVTGFSPFAASERALRSAVAQIAPEAGVRWIPEQRSDLLRQEAVLYRPDQILGPMARRRLRAGAAAYSLCGVTHTLATLGTLGAIADILTEPVMPWDALICTSSAALGVVETTLTAHADYLRWRTGQAVAADRPLTPVIPLGVHCEDFAFGEGARAKARAALALGDTEVAILFAGRLSVSGKAHPYPMLRALQKTSEASGQKLVLLMAGQAPNAALADILQSAAATFCPDVRTVFIDGADGEAYRGAWVAADVFVSLADSIQETFGITPLEAMAAGLPVLVSDWNGYKDTVRDGLDGFRIRTWAPSPGAGGGLANDYATGALRYEEYLMKANTAVSVDMEQLVGRLGELVSNPELRLRLGKSGRDRARTEFDWAIVYDRYRALWGEQDAIRRRALQDSAWAQRLSGAPSAHAAELGPYDTFAGFPTGPVTAQTVVAAAPGVAGDAYRILIGHPLMALSYVQPPLVDTILAALGAGPTSVERLAAATGMALPQMTEVIARLAKVDVLALHEPSPPPPPFRGG